jgi:hypothetical protein
MDKIIEVNCTGTESIDYKSLVLIQGKLKSRTKGQIEKIIRSIIEQGFSFPFFVWKDKACNYILDGHGRILALKELENNGYIINNDGDLIIESSNVWTIPPLPVVFIEAKDKPDAKVKLLKANSTYGNINQKSLDFFQSGFSVREINGLEIKTYENFEFIETNTETYQETDADIELGEIKLNPDIEVNIVTDDDIKIAEEELAGKKPLCIDTIILVCKCCGKNMEIRKSDVAIKINETLYEKEEAHG